MAEPTTTTAAGVSVTVLAVTLMGPTAGPWVAIFACAVAGSLWPLSGAKTGGWSAGAALMARCIATSLILTGLIAGFIERNYGVAVSEGLGPVALAIAAMGNGWRPIFSAISPWATAQAQSKDQGQ